MHKSNKSNESKITRKKYYKVIQITELCFKIKVVDSKNQLRKNIYRKSKNLRIKLAKKIIKEKFKKFVTEYNQMEGSEDVVWNSLKNKLDEIPFKFCLD